MRHGTVFGKSTGLGGAVGLLFPDGRKKDKDKDKKKGKRLQDVSSDLAEQEDPFARAESIHESIGGDKSDVNEGTIRRRQLEQVRRRTLPSLPSPPAETLPAIIPSPPRKESLFISAPTSPTPVFSSEADRISPSPSEALGLNQPVDMNPSIASFISARRRAIESTSEDSELESGQSITSSTLFYNVKHAKVSGRALPTPPVQAQPHGDGVYGIPMPPSPPTSASSPAASAVGHPNPLKRLSQLSYGASLNTDTDDAYTTADDRAPEADEEPDVASPIIPSDSVNLHAPTHFPHKPPTTPPIVDGNQPQELGAATPTPSILDRDQAFNVKRTPKPANEEEHDDQDVPLSSESAPETGPSIQVAQVVPSTREATLDASNSTVSDGRAAPVPDGMNENTDAGTDGPAPATATLKVHAVTNSSTSSTRSSMDGQIKDEPGRSGTFGYATSSSGSGKRSRRAAGGSAQLASIACDFSSPFACGVEGPAAASSIPPSPSVTTPASPVPIHLSPLPSLPPFPPGTRSRSRDKVVGPRPRPVDSHSLNSSRAASRSPPSHTLPVPLTISPSRSPVPAHITFPPSPTSPAPPAVATLVQQDDKTNTMSNNHADDVNNLSSLSSPTNSHYNPTSSTGRGNIADTLSAINVNHQLPSSSPHSAVSPTSLTGFSGVHGTGTTTSAASTGINTPLNASTSSSVPNTAHGDSTATLRSYYTDAATSPTITAVTMSTSSLNSTGLMSLRPPSLSAVTSAARGYDGVLPRSQGRPRLVSRTSSSSQPYMQSHSRAKRPSHKTHHSSCSDCNSDSDGSSSDDDDANALRSPYSPPLDFTAPRPGFVPAHQVSTWMQSRPVKSFSPVPERDSYVSGGSDAEQDAGSFSSNGFHWQGGLAEVQEEVSTAAKRTSHGGSDSTLPRMSSSTSSGAADSLELHSPRSVGSPMHTEDNGVSPASSTNRPPHPLRMVTASGMDELAPPATLEVPISQFARASFGCDGAEADKERENIMAATTYFPQRPQDSDTGSETDDDSENDSDLDLSSDGEYPYHDSYARAQVRSQARANFFGSGSAAARRARRSHASLDSISTNHDELAFDLSHLRSAVLPTYSARASLSSLRMADDPYTPAIPMPRQKSLVNLMRKHEAIAARKQVGLTRSLSHPRIRSVETPLPVVDGDNEFHVSNPPSQRRMWEAATSFLYDEDGNIVCFGDLFPPTPSRLLRNQTITEEDEEGGEGEPSNHYNFDTDDRPPPRTVVFFIRSFMCGMCQDYTLASIARLDPVLLKERNVSVAVIGPGHWKVLKPYRELFKCPFPFYTDPTCRLYRTMGMTLGRPSFGDLGPNRESYHQAPLPVQAVAGIARTARHFPLGYGMGNLFQLGGEFVLGPGYRCEFAHRMRYFGDHMDALKVLKEAGVDHPAINRVVLSEGERSAREELDREAQAASRWEEERDRELDRMRRKKTARRRFGGSVLDLEKAMNPNPKVDDDARSEWEEYVQSWLNPKRASMASKRTSMASKRASTISKRMSQIENSITSLWERRLAQPVMEKERNDRLGSPARSTPMDTSSGTPPSSTPVSTPSPIPVLWARDSVNSTPIPPARSQDTSVGMSRERSATPPIPIPVPAPAPVSKVVTDSPSPVPQTRRFTYNDFEPEELSPRHHASSPKPPYRPVVSPTRKAVPMLSEEEMEELNRESARMSLVVL